jgi:hypothetical protein
LPIVRIFKLDCADASQILPRQNSAGAVRRHRNFVALKGGSLSGRRANARETFSKRVPATPCSRFREAFPSAAGSPARRAADLRRSAGPKIIRGRSSAQRAAAALAPYAAKLGRFGWTVGKSRSAQNYLR